MVMVMVKMVIVHGCQGIQDGLGDYSDCDGQRCMFLPGVEFRLLTVVFFDSFYGLCTVGLDGQDGHGGQGIQDGRGDYSDCDGQSCLF